MALSNSKRWLHGVEKLQGLQELLLLLLNLHKLQELQLRLQSRLATKSP